MRGRLISDDLVRQAADLYQQYGSKRAASMASGIPRETLIYRLKIASERGLLGFKPVLPGFAVSQTTTLLEGGEVKREYIQQKPEHGKVFEVPDGMTLKGVTALTDAEGRVIHQHIMARSGIDHRALIEAAVDELKKELPPAAPIVGPAHTNDLLLNQYTLTDLHFGMLAWGEETRGADYDLKIAEQLLRDWISAAIAMAPHAKVGLLAQIGDFMHHDAHESVTPLHRNVLDADSRLQKIIRVVIAITRWTIAQLLQKHELVHVVMASANHDPASSAWMRELLRHLYEAEPRVTIDSSPDLYYAYEWGNSALFFHHGHRVKLERVDSVFAGKFREIYGRCEYSYGHIGHLHNDGVVETSLMRVERHRTLAPADAYASGGGWLSKRDAKVITYHRDFGEVSRITLSPQMVTSKAKEPASDDGRR